MICEDCPHHLVDSNACCHQSISPVPALIMTEAVMANLKKQWNRHYQQQGVWDVFEEHNLVG